MKINNFRILRSKRHPKTKNQRLQFEAREREACLTVPFAGEVQILYPYQTERELCNSGVDIARVRDIENIYADAQILIQNGV